MGPVLCIPPPRNWNDAGLAGFKGIILNDHPLVLEKLRQITKSFDQRNFANNLVAVYDYVKSLQYYYDRDIWGTEEFWATGPETIQKRGGDCEDHAILLATLIEALYRETYGKIPQNLVWVAMGTVKVGSDSGGHAWVIINLSALADDASSRVRNTPRLKQVVDIVVRDIILPVWERIEEIWRKLDLTKLADKWQRFTLEVMWEGDEYVELESTWRSAISEYVDKTYPYTEAYVAFNSQQYVNSPRFVPSGRPPIGSGAAIKNVAYNHEIRVNEVYSIRVTVRNFDLGILGADLVLLVQSGRKEIARESAYVFRYLWSIYTFSFDFKSATRGTVHFRLELYWNTQGSLRLQDSAEFHVLVA